MLRRTMAGSEESAQQKTAKREQIEEEAEHTMMKMDSKFARVERNR